jgi:hypothetical protein
VRCFVGQISWFEKVLWQQVSHLLLKYTKSGYETVLTAACARQALKMEEICSSERPVSIYRAHTVKTNIDITTLNLERTTCT